jgi:hypothetical protein
MFRNALIFCLMLFGIATAQAQTTVTSNIHNAPGWLHSTTYTYSAGPPTAYKTRVNNGASWNETSYTNGLALNSYELLNTTSPCVSAASGGPTTTASDIADGTCHWKYLSSVDYVTSTGWMNDSGQLWASGTTYGFADSAQLAASPYYVFNLANFGCVSTIAPSVGTSGTVLADGCQWTYTATITYSSEVHNMATQTFPWRWNITACIGATSACNTPGGNLYVTAINAGGINTGPMIDTVENPSALPLLGLGGANGVTTTGISLGNLYICGQTAGSLGSTGTYTLGDGYCNPQTTLQFSSQTMVAINGTDTYFPNQGYDQIVGDHWADREYNVANGEGHLIIQNYHNSKFNDSIGFVGSYGQGQWYVVTSAPGESFGDTLVANPATPLSTTYNPYLGVSFSNDTVPAFTNFENGWVFEKLQISSNVGPGIDGIGYASGVGSRRACNSCQMDHNIFYTGTNAVGACECGAAVMLMDNVIVTKGWVGQTFDYPGYFLNNTVVNVGTHTSNRVGLQSAWDFLLFCGLQVYGNAIYGFPDGSFSYGPSGTPSMVVGTCHAQQPYGATDLNYFAADNVTDTASSASTTSYWFGGAGGGLTTTGVSGLPGWTYSSPITSAFSDVTNLRSIGPTSTLYGARAPLTTSMATSNTGGTPGYYVCDAWDGFGKPLQSYSGGSFYQGCDGAWIDATDVIGAARPTSGRYDIGAIQAGGTSPPPAVSTGGRLIRK